MKAIILSLILSTLLSGQAFGETFRCETKEYVDQIKKTQLKMGLAQHRMQVHMESLPTYEKAQTRAQISEWGLGTAAAIGIVYTSFGLVAVAAGKATIAYSLSDLPFVAAVSGWNAGSLKLSTEWSFPHHYNDSEEVEDFFKSSQNKFSKIRDWIQTRYAKKRKKLTGWFDTTEYVRAYQEEAEHLIKLEGLEVAFHNKVMRNLLLECQNSESYQNDFPRWQKERTEPVVYHLPTQTVQAE